MQACSQTPTGFSERLRLYPLASQHPLGRVRSTSALHCIPRSRVESREQLVLVVNGHSPAHGVCRAPCGTCWPRPRWPCGSSERSGRGAGLRAGTCSSAALQGVKHLSEGDSGLVLEFPPPTILPPLYKPLQPF